MNRFIYSITAAILAAGSAQAQDFYAHGTIQYESLDFGNGIGDMQFFSGDVTVGLKGIAGTGLGFELGLKGYDFSEFDLDDIGLRDQGLFPVVFYDTAYGRFSAGIPRSATGSYFRLPEIAGSHLVSEFGGILTATSDFFQTVVGDTVGLRYDGTFDKISLAVSYHRANNILGSPFDAEVLSAAGSYTMNDFTFALGLNHVSVEGYSDSALMARANYDQDKWGAQLMYAEAPTNGAPLNLQADLVALSGYYRPIDKLTLKADIGVLSADIGGPSVDVTIYGVNAEYDVWNGIYVGAGLADTDQNSDTMTNVYVGYNFSF